MVAALWKSLLHKHGDGPNVLHVDVSTLSTRLAVPSEHVVLCLDAFSYLEEYLKSRAFRGDPECWEAHQSAFQQIVICRRTLSTAGDKLLFPTLAFLIIDDRTARALSRHIERLRQRYEAIREPLLARMGCPVLDKCESLFLLGNEAVDTRPFSLSRLIERDPQWKAYATILINANTD